MTANRLIRFVFSVALGLTLSGCLLPSAPKRSSFADVNEGSEFTVYTMDRKHDSAPARTNGQAPSKMLPTTKNLIFVTADEFTSQIFEKQLSAAYKTATPPTLNDLSWWQFAPLFRDLYSKVIYLPVEKAKNANITAAIRYMEHENIPYDLVILSHGIPNFLTTGETGYFMSFKEIDELKGQLHHLNLVFMQACFGNSLAKDWIAAGAKTVISFDGFNRNFFFIGVFLDHHRWYDDRGAYMTANRDMRTELNNKKLYKVLIETGLHMSVDQYLDQAPAPKITTR